MITMVRRAPSVRDDFPAYAILNKGDTNPRKPDNKETLDAMQEYTEGFPILDHIIHLRKTFGTAAASGVSVLEMERLDESDEKAKAGLEKLIS